MAHVSVENNRGSAWYPGLVKLMPDGTWHVEKFRSSIECGQLKANSSYIIPGSTHVSLAISQDLNGVHVSAWKSEFVDRATIFYEYDHANAPAGLDEAEVTSAINRACEVYRRLLPRDAFEMTVSVVWDTQLGSPAAATISQRVVDEWDSLRSRLQFAVFGVDADEKEEAVSAAFPNSASISYFAPFNQISTASYIIFPLSLAQVFYGLPAGNAMHIQLNPDDHWEAKDSVLMREFADQMAYDLNGVLVHEIGHHLGFQSDLAFIEAGFDGLITVLDIFRLPYSEDATTAQNFSGFRRQMRTGERAMFVRALNDPALTFEMADGSPYDAQANPTGGQGSHWRNYPIIADDYIGIMDVTSNPGISDSKYGSFLQDPDIAAFDLIGYSIDPENVALGALAPNTTSPVASSAIAGAPTAEWSGGAGDALAITVVDIGIGGAGPSITKQSFDGLAASGGTIRIPGANFLRNHVYNIWFASRNWRGFDYKKIQVQTANNYCAEDMNNNGLVDDADFLLFVVQYNLLDCTLSTMMENCSADFNLDGLVDDSDFTAFIIRYNELICS